MADPSSGENGKVSERQLAWGMWFVTRRALLRRIGYGLLIAVAVVSWGYTFWGLIDYYFVRGLDFERAIARDLATARNPRQPIIQRQAARPIQIEEVSILATTAGMYDAIALVTNPNQHWLADVEYALEVPGAPTVIERTALLPGGAYWLVRLRAESKANPSNATLNIRTVHWTRPSRLDIADLQRFVDERLNVEIRQPKFIPPSELALRSGTPVPASSAGPAVNVSRAAFTVVNRSAYGLRDLELIVLLRRGQAIIGANRVTIADVYAGEERVVATTWFHPLGLVQSVEVYPYVNVFDSENFIAL
jgi:hypothetical protein